MVGKRTGRHVLVLNDVAEILDLFKMILEDEGYTVTLGSIVAGEIARIVEQVKGVAPDLVILDFLFGHEPLGWQLLQMLRMDRATADVPIVICTGAVRQVEDLSAHLAAMGVGVVIKPFDVDALLSEVRRVFDRVAGAADLPIPIRVENRT